MANFISHPFITNCFIIKPAGRVSNLYFLDFGKQHPLIYLQTHRVRVKLSLVIPTYFIKAYSADSASIPHVTNNNFLDDCCSMSAMCYTKYLSCKITLGMECM